MAAYATHFSPSKDTCRTLPSDQLWQPTDQAPSMSATQGAVLLLGAPGSGKSTLGRALHVTFGSQCDFLSVGDKLREEGLLVGSTDAGPVKKLYLQARAQELVREACQATLTSHRYGIRGSVPSGVHLLCQHVRMQLTTLSRIQTPPASTLLPALSSSPGCWL
jgi:hypothetical protein